MVTSFFTLGAMVEEPLKELGGAQVVMRMGSAIAVSVNMMQMILFPNHCNGELAGSQISQPAPSVSMESADKEIITRITVMIMILIMVIIILIIIILIMIISTMGKILIMFTMSNLPLGVGDPYSTRDVRLKEKTSSLSSCLKR